MTIPLKREEINLLKDIVSRNNPSLMWIVDSIGKSPLSVDQREELRGVIATDIIQTGLREDYEPDERGLLLENLIDRLGHV
jgi:hypothetical protein